MAKRKTTAQRLSDAAKLVRQAAGEQFADRNMDGANRLAEIGKELEQRSGEAAEVEAMMREVERSEREP